MSFGKFVEVFDIAVFDAVTKFFMNAQLVRELFPEDAEDFDVEDALDEMMGVSLSRSSILTGSVADVVFGCFAGWGFVAGLVSLSFSG